MKDTSVQFKDKLTRQKFFGINNNKTISNIMNQWEDCNKSQNVMNGLRILREQELLKERKLNI